MRYWIHWILLFTSMQHQLRLAVISLRHLPIISVPFPCGVENRIILTYTVTFLKYYNSGESIYLEQIYYHMHEQTGNPLPLYLRSEEGMDYNLLLKHAVETNHKTCAMIEYIIIRQPKKGNLI